MQGDGREKSCRSCRSQLVPCVLVRGGSWNAESALAGAVDRGVPTVILGGLATSTAVSLLALPWLALRFGSFRAAGDHAA
jgi:hypothetical protein